MGGFHNKFSNRFQDKYQDWQTLPSGSLKLVDFETYYINQILPSFPPTIYAMVPQHGPFSLHTMLEGLWLPKTAFPTPMVWPLDENQGSSPLQGHGSRLECGVALRMHSSYCRCISWPFWLSWRLFIFYLYFLSIYTLCKPLLCDLYKSYYVICTHIYPCTPHKLI